MTGALHVQVHPCGARALHIAPLPAGASREGALYPDGGEVTDLKEVRKTLYDIQRPGIAPEVGRTLLSTPIFVLFLTSPETTKPAWAVHIIMWLYADIGIARLRAGLGRRGSRAVPQPRSVALRRWSIQARPIEDVPSGE